MKLPKEFRKELEAGCAPSEIDRIKGYAPGTARKMIVAAWAADNRKQHEADRKRGDKR